MFLVVVVFVLHVPKEREVLVGSPPSVLVEVCLVMLGPPSVLYEVGAVVSIPPSVLGQGLV